jgi:RNA polymerase sigma-70 factor (ECF subfamily)
MPNERGTADVDPESYADQDRFVRVLIRRLVTDQHLAEDLAQDTWLAALRQSAASMFLQRMWLGTVAKNFVLQAARGKVRRLAREKAVARSISVEPEEVLVDESLRRRVLRAVDDLDEPYRSAIRLRFFEDLPPTLIAERLRVPTETVRTRLKRGLAMIRARWFEDPRAPSDARR